MLGAAGPHQPTVHRHHLVGDDVVASQAVLPGQPAHAAARVSPPTPVRETLLVVVASPCRCAALSSAPSSAPPCTTARRRTGFTQTPHIG